MFWSFFFQLTKHLTLFFIYVLSDESQKSSKPVTQRVLISIQFRFYLTISTFCLSPSSQRSRASHLSKASLSKAFRRFCAPPLFDLRAEVLVLHDLWVRRQQFHVLRDLWNVKIKIVIKYSYNNATHLPYI